ncbi:MAG: DUF1697 domain-containing protein [Thermoplasmata archaeon]
MPEYVALLRAVNIGPHHRVSMPALGEMFRGLGFTAVSTLLHSGNVVFQGEARPRPGLEKALEQAVGRHLGVSTDVFVRTASEWERIIVHNPFPEPARIDPAHLVVVLLKKTPVVGALAALERAIQGPERVRLVGDQVYLVYPEGIGRSKVTASVIEKHLGTLGTGRNWSTVQKLGERLQP